MEPKSNILSIETVTSDSSVNKQTKSFEEKFEERLQQLLLGGAAPLKNIPDEDSIDRFGAQEIRRNGKQYFQFGADNFQGNTIISGPTFDPKSVIFLVKNRIPKEHWINESVVQFRNDWPEIQHIVSESLAEQNYQIYQYLRYLQSN
ncbi:uncharacterized protein [Drosophila bipectinata]|uniref:uncharacterized protein n=1 Tax=Drosophila bipectinata TaxID=42026 RepID=UPI001C8AE50E|nr:uncharacterized protein LOC108125004 [Drosophila bipectinata]